MYHSRLGHRQLMAFTGSGKEQAPAHPVVNSHMLPRFRDTVHPAPATEKAMATHESAVWGELPPKQVRAIEALSYLGAKGLDKPDLDSIVSTTPSWMPEVDPVDAFFDSLGETQGD